MWDVIPSGPVFVIVYVNNESIGNDVWFDDLNISYYSGGVLEQNHYYPYGLTLSEQAAGANEQPYKYNTKELERHFGLETYEYGARQYDPQIGRFKGIDELADKYYPVSPFAYVANNPVKFIDPDGKRIIIAGDGAGAAQKQLSRSTSLKLKWDKKTGEVTATGKVRTNADQKLLDAITDKNIMVNIDATNSNYNKNNNWIVGGTFDGSGSIAGGENDGKVIANQTVNPKMTEKIDAFYEMQEGTAILHEALEAYIGAVETPNTPLPTFDETTQEYKNYKNAHDKAMQADPRFKEPNVSVDKNDGKVYINKFDPMNVPQNLNKEELINDRTK